MGRELGIAPENNTLGHATSRFSKLDDIAVYSERCALTLQVPDVVEDDRELCFEILFAGVASVGDSSEVFADAGDV